MLSQQAHRTVETHGKDTMLVLPPQGLTWEQFSRKEGRLQGPAFLGTVSTCLRVSQEGMSHLEEEVQASWGHLGATHMGPNCITCLFLPLFCHLMALNRGGMW